MYTNDITLTDIELINISSRLENDKHYGYQCIPTKVKGIYTNGFGEKFEVVAFFRNCQCGAYDRKECEEALERSKSTGIPVPYKGVDIHRYNSGCQYIEMISTKPNNLTQKKIVYGYECYCKDRSHTAHVYR